MSNLALKYRPLRFEDLVGQEVPAKLLSTLIKRGQQSRNIILSGSFGSGKTSSGRIYGRALNCIQPTEKGSPCNECEQCTAHLEGRHPDYSEYDAASNSKVEQIRDFISIAYSPPMLGRKRILLCDEVHALSPKAWDSLLKVVEEPPEYLTFIFATTELNKVRPAIVSRCQSLQVHTLDHRTSVKHLEHICSLENIEYEKDALELISFISKGHARDLLSNLEQVTIIADTVDKETVSKAFGLANLTLPVKFFKHLIKGETDQLQTLINDWPLSPQSIYATNLQYLLLVWNRHHKESSITLNPLLETLPHADSSTTHLAIRERATQFQVDPEAAYNELFKEFYKYSPNSIESLTLAAISLSYFITTKGFGLVKSISQAAQTTKANIPQPNAHARGRRFVDPAGQALPPQTAQPMPPQGTPQQATVEEISLPSRVYPHTLQGFGFSPIDSAKVKV